MAEGGVPLHGGLGEANVENLKKIRRLRELYRGRFTEDQCGVLLRHKNNDLLATLEFMSLDPREVRHVIGQEDWVDVGEELRRTARRNEIGTEVRQFACQQCDHVWWRKVPARKTVSRCNMCRRRYRAIRRDQEYGWARFYCVQCNRHFQDYGMMDLRILRIGLIGRSQCYCYRCYTVCEPIEILSRRREQGRRGRGRRVRQGHTCTAHNCFNRQQPMRGIPVITFCVHPRSLQTKVAGTGSENHQSTGSTVNTFLSQGSLRDQFEPSLASIPEDNQ